MEKLLFVYVEDRLVGSLCDTIAKLEGVKTVYQLDDDHDNKPHYIVICEPFMGDKVVDDLRVLMFVQEIAAHSIVARQEHVRQIIGVADIPGPLPSKPKPKLKGTLPIIDSVPGVVSNRHGRVHTNISSQAGLASFVGGPCDTETAGLRNISGMHTFGLGGLGHLGDLIEP